MDEAIPYTSNPKYQGISLPLSMDEKWVLHLLFEEDYKRSYLVGIWLGYAGIYHTSSLPELYKIQQGLKMYTKGLITKDYPTDFFALSERTINGMPERSVQCKFITGRKVFLHELEAAAMLQLWNDALKGSSIIKLVHSMRIFSTSPNNWIEYMSHTDILRFAYTRDWIQESELPEGLKKFMEKQVYSSFDNKQILLAASKKLGISPKSV